MSKRKPQRKYTAEQLKGLRREVSALLHKVRKREKRVTDKGIQSPAFQGNLWKSIKRRTRNSIRGKSAKQLEELKTDLEQFGTYSTSYVKGAVHYENRIRKRLKPYGKKTRKEIGKLWDKLSEEGGLYVKFRYEVFDYIVDEYDKSGNLDEAEIKRRLDQRLERLNEEYETEKDDIFKEIEKKTQPVATPEEAVERLQEYVSPKTQKKRRNIARRGLTGTQVKSNKKKSNRKR